MLESLSFNILLNEYFECHVLDRTAYEILANIQLVQAGTTALNSFLDFYDV